MTAAESVNAAAHFDNVQLPVDVAEISAPPIAWAFVATVDGNVTLTRVDGVMVTIPVLAGVVYSLRFIAAEGDGPILAALAGSPPLIEDWIDPENWNDEDIWIG